MSIDAYKLLKNINKKTRNRDLAKANPEVNPLGDTKGHILYIYHYMRVVRTDRLLIYCTVA